MKQNENVAKVLLLLANTQIHTCTFEQERLLVVSVPVLRL